MELSDEELSDLYQWVDSIPLSKPKKNITRDFADGALVAEIVKKFFPKLVDLCNYPSCNNSRQKLSNWDFLNRKVFGKLRFQLDSEVIQDIVTCKPGVIEQVLNKLRIKVDKALWYMKTHPDTGKLRENDQPEADQVYGDIMTGATCGAGDAHSSGTPDFAFGFCEDSPGRKGAGSHKSQGKGEVIDMITSQNLGRSELTTTGPPRPTVPYYSGGPDSQAVSVLMFQEKVQESLVKEETIEILQAKIRRLEHLQHLKDLKIEDLQYQLDGLRPTASMKKK